MGKPLFDIIVLGIIGTIELFLGIYFLTKYEKTPSIIAFGLACLSIGGWVLTNGPTLILETGGKTYDLFTRLAWIFSFLIFIFLYLFILWYPIPSEKPSKRLLTLLLLPFVLVSSLIYGSDNFIKGFESNKYGNTIYGEDYWFVTIYLTLLFFFVIFEGVRKMKILDGIHRRVMSLVLWGTMISGIIGLLNNVFLPYYFGLTTISWLAPAMSVIWLGFVGWGLVKK